jgi:hypothetical protein
MVKGSLGSRMAPIVKALQRLSARQDTSATGTSETDTSETDASATDPLQAASAQG